MNLDKVFEELLTSDEQEELEAEMESNSTAAVAGFETPYAFSGTKEKKDKKKKLKTEALESSDVSKVRTIIRQEVARIFFDLYRKRSTWGN